MKEENRKGKGEVNASPFFCLAGYIFIYIFYFIELIEIYPLSNIRKRVVL